MTELKIITHELELGFYFDHEDPEKVWTSFQIDFKSSEEKQEIREWVERCAKDTVVIWAGGSTLSAWQIGQIGRNRGVNDTMETLLKMSIGGAFGWQIYFRSPADAAMFKIAFFNR